LPAETTIQVRTTTRLSTETNKPGDVFTATLEEPLTSQGRIVAPKGSTVEGRVVEADKGGRVEGVAHIGVTIARVVPSAGRPIEIETSTYTVQAPTTKKKDAVKIAAGSGIGAAIGAIAGGGHGAAIGAAAGAGAGTAAVLATRGDPAVIPSESVLTFSTKPYPTRASRRR